MHGAKTCNRPSPRASWLVAATTHPPRCLWIPLATPKAAQSSLTNQWHREDFLYELLEDPDFVLIIVHEEVVDLVSTITLTSLRFDNSIQFLNTSPIRIVLKIRVSESRF